MKSDLAIIIPAYKADFLEKTLRSFLESEDHRFTLYIGDDAAPPAIEHIVKSYTDKLPIVYHRFNENLGGKSLIAHWERCIALSHEGWIWLFSDDDLAGKHCVGAFYEALEATGASHDVYRFNTVRIDECGHPIAISPPHPAHETFKSFIYHFLNGNRHNTAQEIIFSRSAYRRINGFVDFPLAWGSDNATHFLLCEKSGSYCIDNAYFYFRQSGLNISSIAGGPKDRAKIESLGSFVRWLHDFYHTHSDQRFLLSDKDLDKALFCWFMNHATNLRCAFTLKEIVRLAILQEDIWGASRLTALARIIKVQLCYIYHVISNLRRSL